VIGVDRNLVGGECPYYGCVPTTMIVRAAGALAETRRVNELAGRARADPDRAPVATRIRRRPPHPPDQVLEEWPQILPR
jgi:Pyruvate/2-oxoglutarate dehydrogenase complex, dihydrolipoamide dehydrogenase (E3) component, and related enzymes